MLIDRYITASRAGCSGDFSATTQAQFLVNFNGEEKLLLHRVAYDKAFR